MCYQCYEIDCSWDAGPSLWEGALGSFGALICIILLLWSIRSMVSWGSNKGIPSDQLPMGGGVFLVTRVGWGSHLGILGHQGNLGLPQGDSSSPGKTAAPTVTSKTDWVSGVFKPTLLSYILFKSSSDASILMPPYQDKDKRKDKIMIQEKNNLFSFPS